MSESMLSSIQPRTWVGRDSVRVSTTGDSSSGHSGEAKFHFRDFLHGVNPRHEQEEQEEPSPAMMTGSAADLAALQGQQNPASRPWEGQEESASQTMESEAEPWTLLAPSVTPARASARSNGAAAFKIYARAVEPRAAPGPTPASSAARDE
ncbi:MAG: hypothetical protein G8237_07660 [Magnetococcales bacterium]|nr:hypothetical protein [Magnetococcales bacterium]NGZ06217.1 hypothetical protein [Magnetococcales bacterium]